MKGFVDGLKALGPLGALVLAVMDSAGIPIVGGVDALLIWLAVTSPGSAYLSAALAVIGSVIGSLFLFYIARKGGEAFLDKHTGSPRGARLKAWYLEYGLLTVFVPAVTPIIPTPLKIFVVSAGAMGVNPMVFAAVFGLARFIRYFFIVYVARRLGDATLPYLKQHAWQLGVIAIGLFALLYLLFYLAGRRRELRMLATGSK